MGDVSVEDTVCRQVTKTLRREVTAEASASNHICRVEQKQFDLSCNSALYFNGQAPRRNRLSLIPVVTSL